MNTPHSPPQAPWRVVCLCAQWCDVCQQYRAVFAHVATNFARHGFVWLDIEEREAVVADLDIETFPTLLIAQGAQARFFGPLPPQSQPLVRLLQALEQAADDAMPPDAAAQDLWQRVLAADGLPPHLPCMPHDPQPD